MQPFYEEDGVTIYCGDCCEVLPRLSGITALVSDPVYGIGAGFDRRGEARRGRFVSYGNRNWRPMRDDDKPFDPSHLLSFPVVALFGANHYADKLPPSGKWLVWDKREGSPSDNNSDCELIWTNRDGAARLYSHKWRGIVRAGRENVARGGWKCHPAQKPVSLMKWVLVQLSLPPDALVCDPYAGSGSTLIAAKELGYRAVGIECEEVYCSVAAERLRQGCLDFAEVRFA